MRPINTEEHTGCFNYDNAAGPQIELKRYAEGEQECLTENDNRIIFFLKGEVEYTFHHNPAVTQKEGKILFLPTGYSCSLTANTGATVMIFRLYDSIKLCENYFVEQLFDRQTCYERDTEGIDTKAGLLRIDTRMRHLINGLTDYIDDGIKCRHFFDMKIKEFFLILRSYYTKREICDFLMLILSRDTAFSEYVKNNRNKYPTVIALAESMNLTQKQFSKRFKSVFGRTAYNWMKEGRVNAVHYGIVSTKKPFKQIAIENSFGTISEFTKFCNKELGLNPQQIRNHPR